MTLLTFDEARDRLRDATRVVLDAEKNYEAAVQTAADTEAVYRVELATAFRSEREGGNAVQEAEIKARAAVAVQSRDRDHAAGMLRLAAERLENARDSRRSLWRLIEWSMRASTAAPGRAQDERVPADRWPP